MFVVLTAWVLRNFVSEKFVSGREGVRCLKPFC